MAHDFRQFPELTNTQMQFYYFESPHKQIFEDFTATVTKVIDGDTVKVKWSERNFEFPVRFLESAAPEKKEEGGKESQSWLESQVLDKEVDIRINKKKRVGKYGRLLGIIFANGININRESIRLGFAVPWAKRNEGKIPNFNKEVERSISNGT